MSKQKTSQKVAARLLLSCLLLYFIGAGIVVAVTAAEAPVTNLPDPVTPSVSYDEHVPGESSTVSATVSPTVPPVTELTEINVPLLFSDIVYVATTNETEALSLRDNVQMAINLLWNELECPTYSAEARALMEQEVARLDLIYNNINYDINCFSLWEFKLAEYPYATKTWQYLKELGYSDIACAGILGNLMAECGGHTLALNPHVYDPTGKYYGMFQWSLHYYPEADGLTFDQQLTFFKDTATSAFLERGGSYANGFTIDDFNAIVSTREAALVFAKVYEACADWSYELRQDFSEIAYQYFVLDFLDVNLF